MANSALASIQRAAPSASASASRMQIVFGGGCFWCTEAIFKRLKGVVKVTSGYAGGQTANPTYEEVCGGKTGHAEVVKIEYDQKIAATETLLELFFAMHDPTSWDRQGNDTGSQYRSAIFYESAEQKKAALGFMKKIAGEFSKPIVTEVKKLGKFYPAEEYHKDFYDRNRYQPYCALVISPKLHKLKEKFGLLG
jgi:peptide-methionine (S)-S-oxide reductase